jgi:hypothetical protein
MSAIADKGFPRFGDILAKREGEMNMQTGADIGLNIETTARFLGIPQFSLFARIQTGEVEMIRGRSGEILIPTKEVERLANSPIASLPAPDKPAQFRDKELGVEQRLGGLRRNGETASFRVQDSAGSFTAREINSYRLAFSSIAAELGSIKELKEQLGQIGELPSREDTRLSHGESGDWAIRAELLKVDGGDVMLCERDDKFVVIERFPENSRYAQANGNAEILLQGNDPNKLLDEFKANAQLTLEFMASNLTAKAQRIVWEQFPDERPGHIVAAISERCRQAVSTQETVAENLAQQISRKQAVRI